MTKKRFTTTVSYAPVTVTDPLSGTGSTNQPLASQLYIQSRGQNLITNGTGLLLNNYNFSAFAFDPTEMYSGAGSFLINVAQSAPTTNEYIPIDPAKRYRLAGWTKAGDVSGANYAANTQYGGIVLYDIERQIIWPKMWRKIDGSTDTTLAVALNPGETTMTVTNATGWDAGGSVSARTFSWWPFTNGLGYTWPNYTYTRNHSADLPSNTALGTWAAGAITGNVITLRVPWNGPALPLGTPVRNTSSGQSGKYIWFSAISFPNTWVQRTGYVGGVDVLGNGLSSLPGVPSGFPYGSAFLRIQMLVNYHGVANANIRYSNVTFGEIDTDLDLTAEITRATAAETLLQNDAHNGEFLGWMGM